MNFIHSREYLSGGDTVVVKVSHKCNVKLMTDREFDKYKNGFKHEFVGGFYTKSPIELTVPHVGNWNVAIDLGPGKTAQGMKYNVSFLKRS